MTMTRPTVSRRWFLRSTTGAALAVLVMGAQALFGARAVSAQQSSCCFLFAPSSPWCPMLCAEVGRNVHCWTCNNNRCKCCECSGSDSCFAEISVCSYEIGCCDS